MSIQLTVRSCTWNSRQMLERGEVVDSRTVSVKTARELLVQILRNTTNASLLIETVSPDKIAICYEHYVGPREPISSMEGSGYHSGYVYEFTHGPSVRVRKFLGATLTTGRGAFDLDEIAKLVASARVILPINFTQRAERYVRKELGDW